MRPPSYTNHSNPHELPFVIYLPDFWPLLSHLAPTWGPHPLDLEIQAGSVELEAANRAEAELLEVVDAEILAEARWDPWGHGRGGF